MDTKTPVVLVVLVESQRQRWLVAALDLDGTLVPLLRSEEGDLSLYQGLPFDEQVSFLRHRFCGVLQRGCDRLWPVGKKACQFVFLFDGVLPGTTEELIPVVAEHFVLWMLNPPVVVFTINRPGPTRLHQLAGSIDRNLEVVVQETLASLVAAADDSDRWVLSQKKATWQPAGAGSDRS
jgi:hypothetical protein